MQSALDPLARSGAVSGEPGAAARFWSWYARFSARWCVGLTLLGLLGLLLALPGAVRLYADLRTDLRELLPQNAPAALASEELERRLGGFAQLSVVVRTGDPAAGEKFVDALAARLRALPPSLVRAVRSDAREEQAFFAAHGALFADAALLEQARDGLARRLHAEKARLNPLAVDLDDAPDVEPAPAPADDPALGKALDGLRLAFEQVDRFPHGTLAPASGSPLIVLVSPPSAAASIETDQALLEAVRREVDALRPGSFDPPLEIGYGGEVKEVLEAQEALVRDLLISSALVLAVVSLVLLLYYRTPWSIPLLVAPLALGAATTFSLSREVIPHLNPNTAFLGSIIVGNGINAGIILLARYFDERRAGAGVERALGQALGGTWLATLAASGAAAAAYGSLLATSFRGFNQFGLMGGLGMVLCWLATYLFLPPLVALLEVRVQVVPRTPRRGGFGSALGGAVERRTGLILAATAAVTLLAVTGAVRFVREPFEYDFSKLSSRRGEIDGASHWNNQMNAVLREHQSPSVVLVDSPQQAEEVSQEMDREREAEGPDPSIDSVISLQKLVPSEQPRKLAALRGLFSLLEPGVVARLPVEQRPLVERLLRDTRLVPVTSQEVPARLRSSFRELDGRTGRLVLVTPSLNASANAGKRQIAHARRVRAVAQEAVPGARVAGSLILVADIVGSILDDGLRAAVLSFAAVALLVILLLRSVRDAAWVIASLVLGVLWLFGAMGLLGMKVNFVNFVVLPITFGIGADYAVNLYVRHQQLGGRAVAQAVASAGGAIALCSCTTIIGYASLLVADNRALFSFGLMAVLGELTCLGAALVALPALWVWRARWSPAREG